MRRSLFLSLIASVTFRSHTVSGFAIGFSRTHQISRPAPVCTSNQFSSRSFALSAANPDYAGPEGNRLRAEAKKYGDERHQLLSAANKAFEAGEKGRAKELSLRGKEAGAKMVEANRQAMEAILWHRNEGKGDYYLDLHGLRVDEAISALRDRLSMLIDEATTRSTEIVLEVIPGAGQHSADGKALIKPKVEDELNSNYLQYEEKNAGTLLVTIKSR